MCRRLCAELADSDPPLNAERTAAITIEEALRRPGTPIKPTVGEARAIVAALERGLDRESDEVLAFYDTLKRWVERASRPI